MYQMLSQTNEYRLSKSSVVQRLRRRSVSILLPLPSHSQTAVDLIRHLSARELRPLAAGLLDVARYHESLLQQVGAEHHLREEAAGRVPGDVAVEGPDAGVLVRVYLHHDEAVGGDHLDVAAHGILRVERHGVGVVAHPGSEDVHVEAVGVYWMGAVR